MLKGNEIFEELLQLCRVYQLPTPIIGLERFKDFDIWVVVIDNNKKKSRSNSGLFEY